MINIYIESGLNQAARAGKMTTNEKDFVEKFIKHHFPDRELKKDYDVIGIGGKDKLARNASVLEISSLKNTNIVIFDADTILNGGGYAKRAEEIENIKSENKMKFDLFLWPNNHDDGDFESLLMKMVSQQHEGIIKCFEGYEKCVGGQDPENKKYVLPGRKGCMYTYIEIMKKDKEEKQQFKDGYWLFENPQYWDLDAEYGLPLKLFLEKYLK